MRADPDLIAIIFCKSSSDGLTGMQFNLTILKSLRAKSFSLLGILACLILVDPVNAQVIYANRVGYLPESVKYVYCDKSAESFYVYSVSTGESIFTGTWIPLKEKDPSTGLTTFRGDFTELKTPGRYYISSSGDLRSAEFEIAEGVFSDVFQKSLKAFYFQRCGTALYSGNAGLYQHPVCHKFDGFFHSSTDTSGFHLAVGGWHDAGDYGKYTVNAGITVGTLLLAYELFPEYFSADDLNIPESGNKIPDLLDEVKYELEWLLKMQSKSGGVYAKLTRENFAGFVMPQTDNATRYIYEIASTATGDFAAVTAMAARIYKNFDQSFADSCLAAAKLAWNFLSWHPSIIPAGGFRNPSGTGTGEYGDVNDSDERLWAAVELFNSTGENEYDIYFAANKKSGQFTSAMGWPNLYSMALLSYLVNPYSSGSVTVKEQLKNSLYSYCNNLLVTSNGNGFNLAMSPGDYNWGSNSEVMNKAVLLIAAYKLGGNQDYFNAALSQFNYILGINAHNMSFVTGTGGKYPMHPHHRPSASDGIAEPVPGMLAGGPNQYLQDDVLKAKFNSATPPAFCYADDQGSYASNEIAINWNAPLVFVAGFFNGQGIPVSVGGNDRPVKSGFGLLQNYPNPFNPSTTIKFTIPNEASNVIEKPHGASLRAMIKIYDILGREITTLVNENKSPGEYEVKFDATGMPSGIYFCRLETGSLNEIKKMILMK